MHPAVILAQVLFMTLMIGMPLVGLLVIRGQQKDINTRIWFLAVVLDSLQIPLLALKSSMPSWWTIALPGAIPVMFFTALLIVLKRELSHSTKPSWGYIVVAGLIYLSISSLIYAAEPAHEFKVQAFNNLIFIGFSLLLMILAYSLARSVSSRGMFFVALGFAIAILGYASRAWWHIGYGETTPAFDFTTVGNFQIWTACMNLILMTFGYLGYAREMSEAENARLLVQKAEADTRSEEASKYATLLQTIIDERDQMVMVNSRFLNLSALAVFNSAIVHEISQPLQAIGMCLDNLRAKDAAIGGLLADDINASIDLNGKASEIVLALRQLMAQGDNALIECVNVIAACRSIMPIVESDARQRGIQISSTLPETPIFCECNAVLFQRLIINLVANAFDAFESAKTTSPKLTVQVVEKDFQGKPGISFSVVDNGPGMSQETQDTLFKPFATQKPTGLGIGLSLADILLRKWNGRILVNSLAGGGGTEFEVILPIVRKG